MDIKTVLEEFVKSACGAPLPHPDAVRCAYIRVMVAKNKGNLSQTARVLGLERRTLQRILHKNPDRRVGMQYPCTKSCALCFQDFQVVAVRKEAASTG